MLASEEALVEEIHETWDVFFQFEIDAEEMADIDKDIVEEGKSPNELIPDHARERMLCLGLVPITGLSFNELYYGTRRVEVRTLHATALTMNYRKPRRT